MAFFITRKPSTTFKEYGDVIQKLSTNESICLQSFESLRLYVLTDLVSVFWEEIANNTKNARSVFRPG